MYTLEEYGDLFTKLGLTEMSVKEGDFELVLKKEAIVSKAVSLPADNENVGVTVPKTENNVTDTMLEICSPVVGVFYAGESPEAQPFVKVGDKVKKGDVVCIIEAMKMFNDVIADKDGVVKEVCAENGQLVEFKQPLLKLEPIS